MNEDKFRRNGIACVCVYVYCAIKISSLSNLIIAYTRSFHFRSCNRQTEVKKKGTVKSNHEMKTYFLPVSRGLPTFSAWVSFYRL